MLLRIHTALRAPRRGQTNVEFGLILVLVSLVAIALLVSIGGSVISMINAAIAAFQ